MGMRNKVLVTLTLVGSLAMGLVGCGGNEVAEKSKAEKDTAEVSDGTWEFERKI